MLLAKQKICLNYIYSVILDVCCVIEVNKFCELGMISCEVKLSYVTFCEVKLS